MKNDSISASSKIKELIDLHKSGILSDEVYLDLLKSQIISQWKVKPLKELGTKKRPMKISKKDIFASSSKINKDEYNLLKTEIINQGEVQPVKEKVQKILWILLN
ncbi:MAG: hypothetical protein ABR927_13765 [Bacteroidales bacterium]|jgi:hypothetical protein